MTHDTSRYAHMLKVTTDIRRFKNSSEVEISYQDANKRTYRAVLDAREQAIRRGLIRLGWTPPREIGYFRRIWETIKWGSAALRAEEVKDA